MLLAGVLVPAAATSALPFSLAEYRVAHRVTLPPELGELSAITWDWDNNRLFAVPDDASRIVQLSMTGAVLSTMTLTGFADTEGLTYLGNGQLVIGEEREQDLYRLTYTPGGTVNRSALPGISLGSFVGNDGIEGVCLDRRTGEFLYVKEKSPSDIRIATLDFSSLTGTSTQLFAPALAGLADFSDIQELSQVAWNSEVDNLLLLSQASARLVEITRTGQVQSSFSFAGLTTRAEGVTIDSAGTIFVVGELPELFILTRFAPIPEPTASLGALGTLAILLRRVTKSSTNNNTRVER
jgi:uncharacterized protein YjiK